MNGAYTQVQIERIKFEFLPSASSPLDFFSDNRSKIRTRNKAEVTPIYISLEISRWGECGRAISFSLVHRATLASEKKELGYKSELADLDRNRTNWRSREWHVGPTMLLQWLLAWNGYRVCGFDPCPDPIRQMSSKHQFKACD
jgi:hypothetical protein